MYGIGFYNVAVVLFLNCYIRDFEGMVLADIMAVNVLPIVHKCLKDEIEN
jgi:hypothetical protein